LDKAAAVWEGESESSKEELPSLFQKLTPMGIFAMNNAQHPMFFGKNKNSQSVWNSPNEYQKKAMLEVAVAQIFAEKTGCHLKNKKVFLHQHSFCDMVKNQVNE
jgi:hypothetical protein